MRTGFAIPKRGRRPWDSNPRPLSDSTRQRNRALTHGVGDSVEAISYKAPHEVTGANIKER